MREPISCDQSLGFDDLRFGEMGRSIVDDEIGIEEKEIGNDGLEELRKLLATSRSQATDPDRSIVSYGRIRCDRFKNVPDTDRFDMGRDIEPQHWRVYYDMGLCAKVGLVCYNIHKGTDYKFDFVRNVDTDYNAGHQTGFTKSYITVVGVNQASNSSIALETYVKHNDQVDMNNMNQWWETCICRLEGSEEADTEWNYEAISDLYKGEIPLWLSDDDKQRCYVVKGSELEDMDNSWLHLFTEIAFYTNWNGSLVPDFIADYPPMLTTQEVFVETRGEAETEPLDKLKALNAIFYISFQCSEDPETGELLDYQAVVRKTMDGKPGHMRLEVSCWNM